MTYNSSAHSTVTLQLIRHNLTDGEDAKLGLRLGETSVDNLGQAFRSGLLGPFRDSGSSNQDLFPGAARGSVIGPARPARRCGGVSFARHRCDALAVEFREGLCVERRARRGSRVDPNSETTESVHQETLE